ncbi:MAG: type II toxin-antitoxin system RelE/ParE family toxin [Acidobacteria bacterium]|nr:type II toxin-antitoxin system RelE/ParE family toxin [Acidobacteriota bacterium]
MALRLEFSAAAERDFALIFDHLFDSYRGFGEDVHAAFDHAEARVMEIRAAADRMLTAPHRGEKRDDVLPGLRRLTIERATYWFDIDEERRTVRVLAVFFGGQDRIRRMLTRLLDT